MSVKAVYSTVIPKSLYWKSHQTPCLWHVQSCELIAAAWKTPHSRAMQAREFTVADVTFAAGNWSPSQDVIIAARNWSSSVEMILAAVDWSLFVPMYQLRWLGRIFPRIFLHKFVQDFWGFGLLFPRGLFFFQFIDVLMKGFNLKFFWFEPFLYRINLKVEMLLYCGK